MRLRIAVLLLGMSAVAGAQSSSGYLFFAPGGVTAVGQTQATYHAGGGLDAHLVKGLGLNVELGMLFPKEYFMDLVGVFSPGGTYYFRRGEGLKLQPFVAGGYSMIFRNGHANLYYFGGGINYWFARRVGVRVEFRDHIYPYDRLVHYWGVRMGVAFR